MKRLTLCALLVFTAMCAFSLAQSQTASPSTAKLSVVPNVVRFSGTAKDAGGKSLTGILGVTFALYQEETGGAPLWMETQNVHADTAGHYNVSLGAEKPLPVELFSSGEARWLGVQGAGQPEQPRVLLLSVPYALKAADAETLGGKPASAFLQVQGGHNDGEERAQKLPPVVHGNGTVSFLPLWTTKNIIDKSSLFQSGANVGVGTTSPTALFDVNGTSNVRNTLTLFPNGSAPALSLSGTAFSVSHTGIVSWVAGQTFPGQGGSGTVTSVGLSAPSSDFTVSGSPVTSSGTLSFAWTQAPTASNVANAIVKRDNLGNFVTNSVTASSVVSSGVTATTVTAGAVNATTSNTSAITGVSSAANAQAIFGHATSTGSNTAYGVLGGADGPAGVGVWGFSNGSAGYGVQGKGAMNGVLGWSGNNSTNWNTYGTVGVHGDTGVTGGVGVLGTVDNGVAGFFENNNGVTGALIAQNDETSGFANLISASSGAFPLNLFILDTSGNLYVAGNISKAGGSFKIDHPLDPANKYLYHSFVESPDMMNIYNGVATLDAKGKATVALPDWFEALNRDFRYQLTAIGAPGANLYISAKIANHRFSIAGGKPGAEVSWQVTGIRHDAWADAHRIPVEVEKKGGEQGHYLHPELFGKDVKEFGIPGRAAAGKSAAQP